GAIEPLALIMPPLGGSKLKGPRQRPLLPLRAAQILKPPALPGDIYLCGNRGIIVFTGIVSDVGEIVEMKPLGERSRLVVASAYDPASIDVGASIANAGVC